MSIRVAAFCSALILAPTAAFAEDMAPSALNSLTAVPHVAAAQVMDQNGKVIGQAEQIQADFNGKPAALSFRANDGRMVVVGAAAVSYDGKVLVTSNDQPQIAALSSTRTAAN